MFFVFVVDIMACSLVVISALLNAERRLEVPAKFLRRECVSLGIQGVRRTFLVCGSSGVTYLSTLDTAVRRCISAVTEWQEVYFVYSIGPSCGFEDVLVRVWKPMMGMRGDAIALMAVLTWVVLQASHSLCTA